MPRWQSLKNQNRELQPRHWSANVSNNQSKRIPHLYMNQKQPSHVLIANRFEFIQNSQSSSKEKPISQPWVQKLQQPRVGGAGPRTRNRCPDPTRPVSSSRLAVSLASSRKADTPSASDPALPSIFPPSLNTLLLRFVHIFFLSCMKL